MRGILNCSTFSIILASCRPGTFALSAEHNDGCIRCFCFGRSQECYQAQNYVWSQVTSLDTNRLLSITRGNTNLQVSQGLLLVPGDKGDEVIGVQRLFTTPLYWSLPRVFLGDKVTSYNGELFYFYPFVISRVFFFLKNVMYDLSMEFSFY